jgi:carotenoid 1,2-hydratase
VPNGGYHWHYVDGVSDDGQLAIVVIMMVGNPFSPRYARARERGPAVASDFAAVNVAVYGRGRLAWAFNERRITAVDRREHSLSIGASHLRWDGGRLVLELSERTSPLPGSIVGRVTVHVEASTTDEVSLDREGLHRWWPAAPVARLEVELRAPALRFSGHGYFDGNAGAVPLESTFENWGWSRARVGGGALITYDVQPSNGPAESLALRIARDGSLVALPKTVAVELPRTAWRLERTARVDPGGRAALVRSLEDGPFYARSLISTELDGERVLAMHETLAAHRLARRWVRFCTKYRMRFQ